MSTAKIRFSSDIIRRLGEELNPSPDKGILELVKNSYDADAKTCKVELINTDKPKGTIVVTDDGDGMTVDDIENGWLVLGRSVKSKSRLTRLGRIPAGSKGLGRLAALRMGSQALLCTRPHHEDTTENNLLIDWDEFDKAELVDDVVLTIEQSRRGKGSKKGSEIRIENLLHAVGRMDVKRLARELILLADPFGADPSGFKPELVAPEFEDLEKLVKNRYFEDAEFHLSASVDDKGQAKAAVKDWKGQTLYSAKHADLSAKRNGRAYSCPASSFNLWVFILNQPTFSTRNSTLLEVRNWLQEFGGVHFYHNGLRVAPYGNPGNDWLDINLRRAQSPEERPSTNTSIGRVDVTDRNEILIQKTDRSGFIEMEPFMEMKSFAYDAMEWMADRRMEEAEKRRSAARTSGPKKARKAKKDMESVIAGLPKKKQKEVADAFESYESTRDKETDHLQKDVQLYRTLSTAGITAATFAHESSGNPIKVISQSASAIERRGKKGYGEKYKELLEKPVNGIKKALQSLAVLGTATLKLLDHDKRRHSRVDLHGVIRNVLDTFEPFFEGRGVEVDPVFCSGEPYLKGSEAAIESIVTNLLNNSLVAFESHGVGDRKIRIVTSIEQEIWTLILDL